MKNISFISIFIICIGLLAIMPEAIAKAYYATEEEMIERSEAIAIVDITNVENKMTRSKPFNYRQIADANVLQVFKGSLPQNLKLHGMEDFICAQVNFSPGRYLVFLNRDGDLWAGSNWYLSARPIKDNLVEWYNPSGEYRELLWQPLDKVVERVQKFILGAL